MDGAACRFDDGGAVGAFSSFKFEGQTMKQFLIGLLVVLAALYGAYKLKFPTYSWHQKITVEVETPTGIKSGYSVQATTLSKTLHLGSGGYAKGSLCGTIGSVIPFAKTQSERMNSGDPRLSIQERYISHDDYLMQIKDASNNLLNKRFLLNDDIEQT